ncbi:MAG TPA: DUF1634 domain-containing protein [Bryobacteraceae bacterium]|nr:DUF1634 domain-containing protein [Bryobacteraceae bacterium]
MRDTSPSIPPSEKAKISDFDIEQMISVLLRTGVLIAGAVVLAGGIYYLFRHGSEQVNFTQFVSQPAIDRHAGEIIKGALFGRARSIVQLGILLLIATPIARVAFALVGFAIERDRKYVLITAIVLAVLLYSLISGAVH